MFEAVGSRWMILARWAWIPTAILGVVLPTLIISALSNPLRHRIQTFTDRRFYRSRYDASRARTNLSEGVQDRLDLTDISQILLATADDTLRPQYLALWLREANRKR